MHTHTNPLSPPSTGLECHLWEGKVFSSLHRALPLENLLVYRKTFKGTQRSRPGQALAPCNSMSSGKVGIIEKIKLAVANCFPKGPMVMPWAQFHGSAYRKHIISAYRSREFCAYGKRIPRVSGDFGFCACVLHVTRHSVLTRLAQKFSACTSVGNRDRKRRIRW